MSINISFYLKPGKKEMATIYVLMTWDSKTHRPTTDFKVSRKEWSNGISEELDYKLQTYRVTSELVYLRLKKRLGREPEINELKVALSGPTQVEKRDFLTAYDKFLSSLGSKITKSGKVMEPRSIAQYDAFKSSILSFIKETKYNLDWATCDMVFYEKFREYRISTGILKEDGSRVTVSPNTFGNDVKRLKAFLNWALLQDYPVKGIYKKFDRPIQKVDAESLTEAEVLRLWDADLSNYPNLEYKLDIFLCMLSTGMRISDMNKFNPGWIKEVKILVGGKIQTHSYIEFRAKKTGTLCQVPFVDSIYFRPRFLVDKYKDKQINCLPTISGKHLNSELIKISSLLGIHRIKLTSKTARKTFATIKDKLGINRTALRRMLGHASNVVTDTYVGVSPESVLMENLSKDAYLKVG